MHPHTIPRVTIQDLRRIPAFETLPEDYLSTLAAVMVTRRYAPGQIIFLEGEQSQSLWFVLDGRVKIIKQSESGRVQGLCMMDRGKCFGSCPLFSMSHNPATAEALDNVTLCVIPADTVASLTKRDPKLVRVLTHIYSQRLQHLARVSEVLGAWTVGDRINDCLLTYASHADGAEGCVALTHERLAALAGTVREVVTRHLKRLEHHGVIRSESGRITILNRDALRPPCSRNESQLISM
ncbi:MAG: Crp/Fnr family transcriptional regulator [Chloroflexota bacterium]|nr:MAG: CRP/FNR family transcriptional regulator [Chloroflexi bacterium OLB13]MEB2365644.1 Crp/Fnr family transcriptional regulator [Chloroflexota bacterium]GIK27295.1 MAG: cyclic AMP receptor protein [Chloroflexota bacterium]